jgi:hypothetical protein
MYKGGEPVKYVIVKWLTAGDGRFFTKPGFTMCAAIEKDGSLWWHKKYKSGFSFNYACYDKKWLKKNGQDIGF